MNKRVRRILGGGILYCLTLFSVSAANSGQTQHGYPFLFNLTNRATTSAGVYTPDGELVRTLWGNVSYPAGVHSEVWDGTDDAGRALMEGNYEIRVLSSGVTYTWEGVIGNSSTASTGPSKHRYFQFINAMAISGGYAYYGAHYNEGWTACYKFALNNPQSKTPIIPASGTGQTVEHLATDGNYVYWGGNDPYSPDHRKSFVVATRTSNDAEVMFTNGVSVKAEWGRTYTSCISVVDMVGSDVSGLAVQKNGRFLFVARKGLNQLYVLDKTNGATVQTLSYSAPGLLAADTQSNLWVLSGSALVKYPVQSDGTLGAATLSITSTVAPLGIALSADEGQLLVVQGGTSQQVKAFNTTNGSALWTVGQAGGYANDPNVADDKFYFSDNTGARDNPLLPFVACAPDGSFWVGDAGNYRLLHFSAARTLLEQVMCMPHSYSVSADPNNPSRVFNEYLEFAVDYSKPLSPTNGSWTFVRNWRGNVTTNFYIDFMINVFRSVNTLSNGRTYAFLENHMNHRWHLVELPPSGPLRFTGIELNVFGREFMSPDGSLRYCVNGGLGNTVTWYNRALTGFDASNNPVWAAPTVIASLSPVTGIDPLDYDGGTPGQITSSGLIISFDKSKQEFGRGMGYHLGALAVGSTSWTWRASYATASNYFGAYPSDGSFDTGNYVVYAGGDVLVRDRSIFWSYHGEFWKSSQVNKWQHYYDDGLLVGQFGITGPEATLLGEGAAQMAGNVLAMAAVDDTNGNIYVYHCDESVHGGVHRWKVAGLDTIKEESFPVTVGTQPQGLLRQFFEGADVNNGNLIDTVVDAVITSTGAPATTYSARWTGAVTPLHSTSHTFYVNAARGARLWVDNQLLIDQWSNTVPTEFSAVVALTAGWGYPIRLETWGTVGANALGLSWSSSQLTKQNIPSSQLAPDSAPDRSAGIDLLEGLSWNTVLPPSLYGWTRNPADEDYSQFGYNYWSCLTGSRLVDRSLSPDLYVLFRRPSGTNTVIRDLGTLPSQVLSWTLSGVMSWEGNYENDGPRGGSYMEILDTSSKVICRFNTEGQWMTNDNYFITLYVNGQMLTSGWDDDLRSPLSKPQSLRIAASSNGISLTYGSNSLLNVAPFEVAADWRAPKNFRLYYWTINNNYDRAIDLQSLRFAFNDGDADSDGLPDGWELSNSLAPAFAADAGQDSDGDGRSNLQEYHAGTDPRNASNFLGSAIGADASPAGFDIAFDAVAGRSYTVQYTEALTNTLWRLLQHVVPSAMDTNRIVHDVPGMADDRRFYRVVTPAQL